MMSDEAKHCAARALRLTLALFVLYLPGCHSSAAGRAGEGNGRQALAFRQPEPLLEHMFELLRAGDRAGLQALMVSEREYRDQILLAMEDGQARALPEQKAQWFTRLHRTKCAYALESLIRTLQSTPGRLARIELVGPSRRYSSYQLLPRPVLYVQRPDGGEMELNPGLLVELGGEVKVLSYFSDD